MRRPKKGRRSQDWLPHNAQLDLADVFIPESGMRFDEIMHKLNALGVIDNCQGDPARANIILRTAKSTILADDDAGNLV